LTYNCRDAEYVEVFYSVKGVDVGQHLLALTLLVYPFGLPTAAPAKVSIVAGALLTLLGCGLRYASVFAAGGTYARYNLIMSGQVLLAFAQSMLLNPLMEIS
ncbi:unnamed protein product, partial [Heterosigma akashiwo]